MSAHRLHAPHVGPTLYLGLAWLALGAWVATDVIRGESLKDDDMSLAALALFVLTAILGSRVWAFVQHRSHRSS